MRQADPPLIFHHIPKAAGSVFSSSIEVLYSYPSVFRKDYVKTNWERVEFLQGLDVAERAEYKLILGHMPFGVHSLLPGSACYFSFVREPISRMVSLCRFISERPNHYLHQPLLDAGSVEIFVKNKITNETHNEMVRYFCSWDQISDSEAVSEHHLRLAKDNILNFFPVVGLTEFYDESVVLFSHNYQQPAPYYIRRNQSKSNGLYITGADKEAIRHANLLDLCLYEWLTQRFNQQLEKLLKDAPSAVSGFQKRNHLYGKYLYVWKGSLRKLHRKCSSLTS